MKQLEADFIAKMIRNLDVDLEVKKELAETIGSGLFHMDQFFNLKRFKNLAELSLDEQENTRGKKVYLKSKDYRYR